MSRIIKLFVKIVLKIVIIKATKLFILIKEEEAHVTVGERRKVAEYSANFTLHKIKLIKHSIFKPYLRTYSNKSFNMWILITHKCLQ